MYIYTFIYLQYYLTAFLIFVGEVSTARQHGKQSIGQGNVHCCTPPSTRCTPQQSVNGLEMCLPPQTQTQSYNAILCTYLHVLLLISTLRMTSSCNIYIYIYICDTFIDSTFEYLLFLVSAWRRGRTDDNHWRATVNGRLLLQRCWQMARRGLPPVTGANPSWI